MRRRSEETQSVSEHGSFAPLALHPGPAERGPDKGLKKGLKKGKTPFSVPSNFYSGLPPFLARRRLTFFGHEK
jgi:hypothetical protein